MRPPKNSAFHSWETLKEFVGANQARKIGNRTEIRNHDDQTIGITSDKAVVLHFTENDILFPKPRFKSPRTTTESIANPILTQFGWYWGSVVFGPHRKYHYALKPTRITPGSPECDYRSVARKDPRFPIELNWDGKILKGGLSLTPAEVKRLLRSYDNRSQAMKTVRQFAYTLGFPDTAKMKGFQLPKNKDIGFAQRLNAIARQYGYQHIAHAWFMGANLVPQDESELEMLEQGLGFLTAQINPTFKGARRPPGSDTYRMRFRPLIGEELAEEHMW